MLSYCHEFQVGFSRMTSVTPSLPLQGKNILLGISGGIAAYKAADLVRRLKERGADVRVILTPAAAEFITPLTLQALSGNPVGHSLLDPAAEAAMGHIELARWADFILVAPASADVIARIAHGMANDLLTTCILAAAAPMAVAPAMNQQMYKNIAVQNNLATLKSHNILIYGPAAGAQACCDVGMGRMLEPLQLADMLVQHFQGDDQGSAKPLTGLKFAITAGPTREAIDPVRYISNHSSGKMGYALAAAAAVGRLRHRARSARGARGRTAVAAWRRLRRRRPVCRESAGPAPRWCRRTGSAPLAGRGAAGVAAPRPA